MSDLVSLTIDGVEVQVPPGTLVVDAAKQINHDIPVFCYHPKLEPVGMCRMCLVEIGRPMRDRATGELMLEADGSPKLMFRGLETACTVPVSEGMAVRGMTDTVTKARNDVVEFLLTSHPLDCPICDKGGECPLQNLTMAHGKGTTRFDISDKIKLDKHVPLGDLIYLDRERCIQCARCTRFQSEVVDDPVIAFHNRGRSLEIVTLSDPGFDSIFSGNTTDICPVGALTTADFRFGARPWELTPVASLCPHCPVGCNTTMSTRREARSGGRTVVKRIMPRQNESVNEIWLCDKGRFVHHFAEDEARLTGPLVRKNGELVPATWDEALHVVAEGLRAHKDGAAGLAGDRLSNEDLFLFQKLFRDGLGSANIDLAQPRLAGGDVVAQVGLTSGSNLGELGAGDAILVVAADLHQAAPIWWLRVKQAVERGATLVVVNGRPSRLDSHANYVLPYLPGHGLAQVRLLLNSTKIEGANGAPLSAAAEALVKAHNLVIFYGGEGLTYAETDILARALANLLLVHNGDATGHAGRRNSGLVPVWPRANTQGAWDMGVRPGAGPGYQAAAPGMSAGAIYQAAAGGGLSALYVAGADPVGDGLLAGKGELQFLVVQDLFLTATAAAADVVLPAQSWAEREGTYTSGERRVQRFYPALQPVGESRADWRIFAQLGERFDLGKTPYAAGLVFKQLAAAVPQYAGMSYKSLAQVEAQWPVVGESDLYYGGTSYKNDSGLGQQWASAAESGAVSGYDLPDTPAVNMDGLPVMHVPALYSPSSRLVAYSPVIETRVAATELFMNEADAAQLGIADGDAVNVVLPEMTVQAQAYVNGGAPAGVALLRGAEYHPGSPAAEISKVDG